MRSFCIMSMILFVKCLFCIETHISLRPRISLAVVTKGILGNAFKWAIILSVFVLYFFSSSSFSSLFYFFSWFLISSNKNSNESKAIFLFLFLFYAFLTPAAAHYRTSPWFIIMLFYIHRNMHIDLIAFVVQLISIFHFLFSFRHIHFVSSHWTFCIWSFFFFFFGFRLVVKMKWFDFGIVYFIFKSDVG